MQCKNQNTIKHLSKIQNKYLQIIQYILTCFFCFTNFPSSKLKKSLKNIYFFLFWSLSRGTSFYQYFESVFNFIFSIYILISDMFLIFFCLFLILVTFVHMVFMSVFQVKLNLNEIFIYIYIYIYIYYFISVNVKYWKYFVMIFIFIFPMVLILVLVKLSSYSRCNSIITQLLYKVGNIMSDFICTQCT